MLSDAIACIIFGLLFPFIVIGILVCGCAEVFLWAKEELTTA